MSNTSRGTLDGIVDLADLRERRGVFADRRDAGAQLGRLLEGALGPDAVIAAVPAGGVPVAVAAAEQLEVALDVVVVSKVTLPWNTESGYGAVAFDGTVRLNEQLLRQLNLDQDEVQRGIASTRAKVERRVARFRSVIPPIVLSGKQVVLVDDGVASGFTLQVAAEAVRRAGPSQVAIAVPTGHLESLVRMRGEVDAMYCANVRSGWSFAVASAYRRWRDVDEEEVLQVLSTSAGRTS